MAPTINRRIHKEKPVKYNKENKSDPFYSTIAWKRMRDTLISLHPLCMECLRHERVTPATTVHHIRPFLRGETEEEQWKLFLDEKNCMCLCEKCHIGLHNKDREYHLAALDNLTDKEYNEIHGIFST